MGLDFKEVAILRSKGNKEYVSTWNRIFSKKKDEEKSDTLEIFEDTHGDLVTVMERDFVKDVTIVTEKLRNSFKATEARRLGNYLIKLADKLDSKSE